MQQALFHTELLWKSSLIYDKWSKRALYSMPIPLKFAYFTNKYTILIVA